MLPIIRTFISLPAGVAKMPFWRFTVLTLLGCIPWVLMLGLIGEAVGENWEEWRDHLHYLDYAVVAAVARRRRLPADPPPPRRRAGRAGGAEADAAGRAGRSSAALERAGRRRDPAPRALALGVVQGPAELLPVSSSAHIVLVPWLAGWDWERARPGAAQELRGRAARRRGGGAADRPAAGDRRRAARLRRAGARSSSASPSCRRRSSATRSSARSSGASAGRGRPRSACSPARRRCWSPTPGRSGAAAARRPPRDGLALGVAQAAALAPGVSRNGVTLAAARWRRLLPRPGEPALAHDRAADHRRRHRAQGRAPGPPRRFAGAAPLDGARRRRLLRLDPRLPAADPAWSSATARSGPTRPTERASPPRSCEAAPLA